MKKYTGIKLLATGVLAGIIGSANQQIVKADEDQPLTTQRVHLEDTLKSISKIKGDLAELKNQKEQIIEHLVVLEKKSAEAKIVLNEESKKFSEENKKYEEIEKEHSIKLQKLEQLKKEIMFLKESLSEKNTELQETKKKISNLICSGKKELSESEKENLKKIEDKKVYYTRELANGIKLIADYQEIIEKNKKIIAETKSELAQMEKDGRTNDSSYKIALRRRDVLSQDLEIKNRTVANKKNMIGKYELELKSIEVEIRALTQNAESPELEAKIESKKQELSKLEDIIDGLQVKLLDKEKESERISNEICKQPDVPTDVQLQETKKILEDIDKEILDSKRNLENLEQKIDSLSKDLDNKNTSDKELNDKMAQLEVQKKEAVENIKKIDNSYKKLTEQQKLQSSDEKSKKDNYQIKLKFIYQPKQEKIQKYTFKAKGKNIFVKVGNQWKKVNHADLKKYLSSTKSKFNATARVKTKKKKLQLVTTTGKKTNAYVRKNQKIKVQGIRLIKNRIYVHVNRTNLLPLMNVELQNK